MSGKNYSVDEDADWEESFVAPMRSTVPSDLGGMRFDQALARLFPQYSRSRLQAWLKAGHIRLDGRSAEPRYPVTGGEHVLLEPPPARDALAPKAQRMPLRIVHEDADLIVLDKPAGLVVHPGAGQPDRTLLNGLLAHAPALAAVPRAGIVHRLDKDTSGLLVVAKTVVERFGHAALLECRLETGRTHQIRVHLQHIRHPLVGDPVYRRGTRHGLTFPRQALHAAELSLVHPRTGQKMTWRAPLPKDMKRLLQQLGDSQ
jgi:23S rRNA-/tRNA-specific pseudouridylate synthase